MIDIYKSDATMNGLSFDRHSEEKAVELFAFNIMKAGESFLKTNGKPFIPTWSRVISALPEVFKDLKEAVREDDKKFR